MIDAKFPVRMLSPIHFRPTVPTLAIFATVILGGFCAQQPAPAQELRAQTTPLTAWIDLRPAAPEAGPQTAPNWIEAFEYIPAKKATDTVESVSVQITGAATDGAPATTPTAADRTVTASGESVYRIRVHRPAAGVGDLQVRIFYEDRAEGGRPWVSVWNELGSELMRSEGLGQGLGLSSSETFTVPMAGADYLELAAPGDGSQLRAVFLSWLEKVEVQQPADFASKEVAREPFGIQPTTRTHPADSYLYGVVTARLQDAKPAVLQPNEAPAVFQFQLERQPLVAVITYEVLGATLGAAPTVAANASQAVASEVGMPDLADPGYQGRTREGAGGMSFHYTGWVRAQKVIPGSALAAGLNNLTIALSKDSDSVAIRSVQIQLKYNWEKLDYLVTPTPASYDAP